MILSSRMPSEPAKPRYLLTAQLLHPPVIFSGSLIECSLSVRLETVPNDLTEPSCQVVGLVANVVGQYKVDQSLLRKHKLTAPVVVELAVESTSHTTTDLWFDSKAVFASALEDNTNLLFCAPASLDVTEPRPTEQFFRLWTQLPPRLPPSVRGKLMKIAYKLLVAVQVKLGSRTAPRSHLLQIPFRLLPAPSMYQPLRALDMGPKPHLPPDIFHSSDNPFWAATGQSEFVEFSRLFTVQPIGGTTELATADSLHMVNAGQLRNTLLSLSADHGSKPAFPTKDRGRDFPWSSVYSESKSVCEINDQLMLGFDRPISATQPTNFMISCSRGFVVRFCMLRTLFRLDDTIRGFFDFSAAEVLCTKCQISLQNEERYSNYTAPSFVGAIPGDGTFEGTESTVAFTSQFLDEDGKTAFASQDISDGKLMMTFFMLTVSVIFPRHCLFKSCLLMEAKYDSALLGILQHEGKIEKFLDVVFGFLMRRTDFYHIMTPDQKKLGFPPGVSLRMVVRAFERYKTMFENYEEQRREAANSAVANKAAAHSKGITARYFTYLLDSDTPVNSSKETLETGQTDAPPVSTLEVQSTESIKPEILPNTDRDADDTPGVYQADPECYNGAIRDCYTWSQSIKDVDINIKVPPVVKTGKDLKVVVDRKRVRVFIKSDGTEQTYFDRSLCWDVVKDEAVWTLQPKESQVHLCLDKVQERWWEAAFEGEDKINTRKIDCSRPMHELDEEAQAKIHQLMYDEQRKRQGLPTSEQQKVHDMLAKAWDQEGSPFRGTPFDPSKINIAPS
ncbi:hypothetical protein P879_00079 [Paragonimus westermani]|uniref:CS domain-containing protein n=1 Tax=Paragonimus westermani TaxID=34504 RepID=A0A8T0DVJ7_9TREM|nr:hypothetical protein P879_00079 [Paragonimus westermani]